MLVGIRLLASAVFGVSRMFHNSFAILLYFEFISLFLLYFEFLSLFLLYFEKISFIFWNYFAFRRTAAAGSVLRESRISKLFTSKPHRS
jgi:hypothetical protein